MNSCLLFLSDSFDVGESRVNRFTSWEKRGVNEDTVPTFLNHRVRAVCADRPAENQRRERVALRLKLVYPPFKIH